MRTVVSEHHYSVSPDRLWALVTDYSALKTVMDGMVAFEGLPEGRAVTGQKCEVMVSLFGRLPAQPYVMEVVLCDDAAMVLQSSERGAGVKSWRHHLCVEATSNGCKITDRIEIDAGLMTPFFALWARYMYRARHKPRLALFDNGTF